MESYDKKIIERYNEEERILKNQIENIKKEQENKRILDSKYICISCDYGWETRKSFGKPSKCPKCNSDDIKKFSDTDGYWNEEYPNFEERLEKLQRRLSDLKIEDIAKEEKRKIEDIAKIKSKNIRKHIYYLFIIFFYLFCWFFYFNFAHSYEVTSAWDGGKGTILFIVVIGIVFSFIGVPYCLVRIGMLNEK